MTDIDDKSKNQTGTCSLKTSTIQGKTGFRGEVPRSSILVPLYPSVYEPGKAGLVLFWWIDTYDRGIYSLGSSLSVSEIQLIKNNKLQKLIIILLGKAIHI